MSEHSLRALLAASKKARRTHVITPETRERWQAFTGRTFGALTVLGEAPTQRDPEKWRVRCVCGKERTVFVSFLLKKEPPVCLHDPATRRLPGPRPTLQIIGGEETTIADYAKKYGVKPMTLYQRKARGLLALPGPERRSRVRWRFPLHTLVAYTPEPARPWIVVAQWVERVHGQPDLITYRIRPAGTRAPGAALIVPEDHLAPWTTTERDSDAV